MAVIEVDAALDKEALEALRNLDQIVSATEIELISRGLEPQKYKRAGASPLPDPELVKLRCHLR
jgi:hypothetical protein